MRNKTIEFSVSDETPKGGGGEPRDLVIGRYVGISPIEANLCFWE